MRPIFRNPARPVHIAVGAPSFDCSHCVLHRNEPLRVQAFWAPGIVNGTLGLLDALSSRDEAQAAPAVDAGFRAACGFIDRHIGDPALSAKSICQVPALLPGAGARQALTAIAVSS